MNQQRPARIGLADALTARAATVTLGEVFRDQARRAPAWMNRIAAIGHGARGEITAAEALDVARTSAPAPLDPGEAMDGMTPGDHVAVVPEDRASPPVEGTIARLTEEEIAVYREDPRVGAVVVHFPRFGYIVERT